MRVKIASALVFILSACGGAVDSDSTQRSGDETRSGALTLPPQARVPDFVLPSIPVCPGPVALGNARCHSHVVTDPSRKPVTNTTPRGYGPADLQAAYQLPSSTAGSGQTIAIVDAYDDPKAESDLGVYRSYYGLPECTTANGCFKKVNQNGVQGSYPRANQGWALEISLDLQMASAICPNCKILLVEASSNSMADLGKAVNRAAALGANVISNSYGASEYSSEASDEESYFDHPGVAITVSSGDSGYGVEFPAASRCVTAVGGTSLLVSYDADGTTPLSRSSETAWSGAGSGCSAYIPQPSWQTDLNLTGCSRRMVADVSAVADPNTGVAVYDSYGYQGKKGWFVVGGTSVSSPIVASVYALAGNTGSINYGSYPYSNYTEALYDVITGSNGDCSTYLCTAVSGYDGPTGLGTPNQTGAF